MSVQKTHVPLATCRVLYLGSAVPLETVQGLDALQVPLRQRYVCSATKGDVSGIDLWLKVYSSGLMLTPADDPASSMWFPVQSLKMCAAVKCVELPISSFAQSPETASPTARFVPADSPEAASTKHPPLFSAVMRKTTGVKVLECHVFICKSDRSALELVRSLMFAHDNKDGWLDEEDMPDVFFDPAQAPFVTDDGAPVAPAVSAGGRRLPDFSTNTLQQDKAKATAAAGSGKSITVEAVIETKGNSSRNGTLQAKKSSPTSSVAPSEVGDTDGGDSTLKSKKGKATKTTTKTTKSTTAASVAPSTSQQQPAMVPMQMQMPAMNGMMPGAVPMMMPNGSAMMMPGNPVMPGGPMMVGNPMMPGGGQMVYPTMPNYYANFNMYGTMPFFEVPGDPYETGTGKKGKDKYKDKGKKKDKKYDQQQQMMMSGGYPYPGDYGTGSMMYGGQPVHPAAMGFPTMMPMPVPVNMDDWRRQEYERSLNRRGDYSAERHSDLGYYGDRRGPRDDGGDVYYRGTSSRHSDEGHYRDRTRDFADESPRQYSGGGSSRRVRGGDDGGRQQTASSSSREIFERTIVRDGGEDNMRERQRNGGGVSSANQRNRDFIDDEVIYAPINKSSTPAANKGYQSDRQQRAASPPSPRQDDAVDFRSNFVMRPDTRQSRAQQQQTSSSTRDASPAGSYARHIDIGGRNSRNVEQQFREMFVGSRPAAR